jgi:demethylmenaquinone methyltransferase/2-methoxy-6-polyprenyl-1,4-benzoquinol methylase
LTTFKLPSAEEKAEYVHQQFERIARRYDLTNDCISMGMHRFWKHRAVTALQVRADGSYLDVCCGTGDLALTIAARLGERGMVTGFDFSGNMLEVARARGHRAAANGRARCQLNWKQGDAQHLTFPDDTFDGAIISFGLRNLTDLQKGLNEMQRVVKPGGKVINLDLGEPTAPIFTPAFNAYFRHVVPIIGEVLQHDRKAYTYLPESRNTYPKPPVLTEMFERAGLRDVKWIPLAMGSVAMHVGTVG